MPVPTKKVPSSKNGDLKVKLGKNRSDSMGKKLIVKKSNAIIAKELSA